jgi:mannitol-specific phosphotransferase system IIBC component
MLQCGSAALHGRSAPLRQSSKENEMAASISAANVDTIIFACEAGMGSSIMGVNALKKKLKQANVSVNVVHKSVRALPSDAKVVLTHKGLAEQARQKAPGAVVVSFSQFLNDPVFDKVVQTLKEGKDVQEVR